MKLKEKILLEKLADEYAIGFAEWCDKNEVSAPWEELLEIYKNETQI